ncbi:MAG TPA: septal ring lytic transglycosylase RlpA family protein [Coleofasciculaceae cyanobacterium]|jgi:rare lipoprotein A
MVSKKLATLLTLGVMIGQTGLLSSLFAQAETQVPNNTISTAASLEVASVIQNPEIEVIPDDILKLPGSDIQPVAPEVYTIDLGEGQAPDLLKVVPQGEADASLFVNDQEIVRFQGETAGIKAYDRAKLVAERLSRSLTLAVDNAAQIKPAFVGKAGSQLPVVRIGQETLVTADPVAAKAAKLRPEQLAFVWANRLREALHTTSLDAKDYPEFNKPAMAQYNATGRMQSGMASWYGPGFHGRRTASGSRFNQFALTAAHRTLPFGTLVRVTNQRTKRSCVVQINDRGPYAHGRIIDLSQGAAKAVGLSGVGRVVLEVVNRG